MKSAWALAVLLFAWAGAVQAGEPEPQAPRPRLAYLRAVVDDTIVGNGNGILEPGETARLQVGLYNAGTATAWGVYGTLYTEQTGLTIEDRSASFGDVIPGQLKGSIAPHFQVALAGTIPCGKDVAFTLVLTASNADETLEVIHPLRTIPARDLAAFEEDMVAYGADPGDSLGMSVAFGDINGDGFDDLIVGASNADGPVNGKGYAGEVWILYGAQTLRSTVDLASPPAGATVIYGASGLDFAGISVSAGDVNGDGYEDVILGAYGSEGPGDGRADAGEVWVVYGKALPPASVDLATSPAGTTVIYGADAGDFAGTCVASGDINDDGYDDVLIGAQGDGPANGRTGAGEVWVVYGSSTPPADLDLASNPPGSTVIYGADADDLAYEGLASGDVNGDGYADIVLGAEFAAGPNNGRPFSGEVWLIFGAANPPHTIDLSIPPQGSAVIYGADPGDRAGCSVAAGDVNGDGYADILLGSWQSYGVGNSVPEAGEAWIVLGSDSLPPTIDLAAAPSGSCVVFGGDSTDDFGYGVACGDRDGDGYADMAIGAHGGDGPGNGRPDAGEVWTLRGSPSPPAAALVAIPPADAGIIYGADSDDDSGYFMAFGDMNGDGYEDMAITSLGASGPANGRAGAGEVAVLFGRPTQRYSLAADSFAFIDATAGTSIGLGCDSCCQEVSLGFPFEFYNRTYSSVWVCDDGYLSFSPVPAPHALNFCFPDRHSPDNVIAAFWDDLNPAAGGAVYKLAEGPPNRRMTIEWAGVPLYQNTGAATFEVTLFEGSNQILVQYQDTLFGSGADSGATATAGVENITGVNGQQYSCYAPNLVDSSAWRAVPFGAYRLFRDNMEGGVNGWSVVGDPVPPGNPWHQENGACSPWYQSPSTSWYYGSNMSCKYDVGPNNYGRLLSPSVQADYYSALSHRFRRDAEMPYDKTFIQVREDLGSIFTKEEIVVDDGLWHSWWTDISAHCGHSVQAGFYFTADGSVYELGWMIDDVEVWGCDRYGTTPLIDSLAYARPKPVCETASFLLDGTGTYAQGCSSLTYQWYENSAPIPGATTLQYTVPANHATGVYGFTLRATCVDDGTYGDSSPVSLQVVPMPAEVPQDSFRLEKVNGGTDIHMVWANVTGGDTYGVYRDLSASGGFSTLEDNGADGPTGVTIPMPPEGLVFYLVAGENATCGIGPKR